MNIFDLQHQIMKDYRSYISSFIRIADPIIKKRVDVEFDLPADPIALRHCFHPVDYLPENDCIRFTIHPEARKEVLRRLLLLNHARYAEEVKEGLHGKGAAKQKPKPKREEGGRFFG